MSQFDALLEFNDTSTGSGTVQKSPDFDPFGPSPSVDVKGSSDGDLLVDFGFTGQTSVTTNGNTNGQSVNPLYELSMDQDFTVPASNSLIMADDIQVSQKSSKSANPLYDLENEQTSSEPSANPLYDLSDANGHSVDLLGQETLLVVTDDSGFTVETETSNNGGNLLINTGGDSQELQFDVRRDESHESMNGISDEDSELVERFTEAERGHIIQESQEILQNQNLIPESNVEQRQISLEDQQYEPEVLVYEPEGEDQNDDVDQTVETREEIIEVSQTEPAVVEDVQYDQQIIETTEEIVIETQTEQEVVQDTQTERELIEDTQTERELIEDTQTEQELIEVMQTEQELIEVTQTESEPVESTPQEDIFDISANANTTEIVTEVVTEEQEVIPSVEFRSRSSSSSSNEEKETTTTKTVTERGKAKTVTEKTQVTKEGAGDTVTTTQKTVVENGLDEGVFRDSKEQEEISFDQMSSIRNKLESNKMDEVVSERKKSVHEEIADAEGGEYENEPVRNPDVVRESDKDIGAELPEVGTARNIMEKFKQIETTPKTYKREATPPEARKGGKVEYVSEPTANIETPVQKVEGGIFENQPVVEEDVVHSYDAQEEVMPEKGSARNILERFKQIQSGSPSDVPSPQRRELTPDRNTRIEYVSEPRSVMERYEGKVESGIFESQPTEELPDIIRSGMSNEEVLPEKGTAKNLASRYIEFSDKAATPQVSQRKRELTPDKTGKVEFISEPRSTLEKYEGKSEVGVFESRPEDTEEIVKSDVAVEDVLPERGAAKNIAAKFREIESSNTPSPTSTPKPKYKEVTPPRDDVDGRTVSGMLENTPTQREDIVKSSDVHDVVHEEELPERGMAKNIADKFRHIQQTSSSPSSSPSSRGKKDFTPPPEKGVFESTPQPSLKVEVRQAESGILESTPTMRDDVAREDTFSAGDVEFPEEGYAKNMVSKWKHMESQSGKTTPSPKGREFTPPRDYPMSPKSPAGVDSSVQPSDLPGQYQEQKGYGGVYENKPSQRYDVAREGESDVPENMPEKDAAKSMVQKFKAIQDQAKKAEETPKPVSRKDSSEISQSPVVTSTKMFESSTESPKGSFVAVQLEKCAACQKTVYAVEKLEMNKNIYHRACFKCSHCKCVLTAKTFSMNEGVIYCTNHFKQLFARKGNYDEGFGRQQYKKKWGTEETNGEQ